MANSVASKTPGLKQFRQEGCLSYLFFDAESGDAMLVDPRADLTEEYRGHIAEHKLTLRLVVDTRLHWHHLSGSHLLAESYGVPIAMSSRTSSERATRKLDDQDKITVGAWEIEVLETPGVSPDAICLRGAGLLWSGDTVLIGEGARTDLPGGDAASLWVSLRERIAALPAKTVVLPGYDQQEIIFSTLEVEKRSAPDWRPLTQAAFAQAKADEKSKRGEGEARHRLEYNMRSHPAPSAESRFGGVVGRSSAVRDGRGVATINVQKLAQKMKDLPAPAFGRVSDSGLCLLDVREPAEFRERHMPGAINVPLSELALQLALLASFKRIYVSCQSGSRSALAARTLDYLGFPDVVHVSGGIRAWENAGLPLK